MIEIVKNIFLRLIICLLLIIYISLIITISLWLFIPIILIGKTHNCVLDNCFNFIYYSSEELFNL